MTEKVPVTAALRWHLGDKHALGNWPDCKDPEDVHRHEHEGPGTIRNHDPLDLSADPEKAIRTWGESVNA